MSTNTKLEENIRNGITQFLNTIEEATEPGPALISEMMRKIQPKGEALAKSVGGLALDCLSRKTTGISFDEAKTHFTKSVSAINTLKKSIENALSSHLPNGRLIVFIDDLDRCDIENILAILSGLKLFLSSKQCLFVLAVDKEKLEFEDFSLKKSIETKFI